MRGRALVPVVVGFLLALACDGSPEPEDAGDASSADGSSRLDAFTCVDDEDGDGVRSIECGGGDCDDSDPLRYPDSVEVCDLEGRDEDCDPTTFGVRDIDGDGFPDGRCCNDDGEGGQNCGTDCDEARASTRPGASEVCNRLDDDCDGAADEGAAVAGFLDMDADGHGDPAEPRMACPSSARFSLLDDDCDDASRVRHGALNDFCDAIDNDCDGSTDETIVDVPWYRDLDEDTFGAGDSVLSCTPVAGRTIEGRDCDDARATRHPAANEICNGVDDDCNGLADFEIALNDWEDDDGDGFADLGCADGDDCDDRDRGAFPGGTEVCNDRDDDCDSRIDEACVPPGSLDGGTPDAGVVAMDGGVDGGHDACVAGLEICDGLDQDCDSRIDEGACPVCDPGYEIIDLACVDIDECLTGASTCDPLRACENTDGDYLCGLCGMGYLEVGPRGCADIDECAIDNGGCDLLVSCDDVDGGFSCGPCPSTHVGTGETGCVWDVASLDALGSSAGTLSFAPGTTTYLVPVGTTEGRAVLTPLAPPGFLGTITVAGVEVSSGSASAPQLIPVGDTIVNVVVTAASGSSTTYAITYRRTVTTSYVKPSNPGLNDSFGFVVDIDGDTMVVGTLWEDGSGTGVNPTANEGATDSGAVYVYVRSGDTWTQQAYIKATNAQIGDGFGSSVAIDGDTLIVGAPHEASNARTINGDQANNAAGSQGAAYVYTRSGTTWSFQAYLKASDGVSGAQLGRDVDIDGDLAVVGSTYYAVGEGAAYVFRRTGTTWAQASRLFTPVATRDDFFGDAVAISGTTIVVGATGEDSTPGSSPEDALLPSSGAVYVFGPSGPLWVRLATLRASNAEAADGFGAEVDASGGTIVISAPYEDSAALGIDGDQTSNTAPNSGAVYVFTGAGATWTQEAYIKSTNTGFNQSSLTFGISIAIDGDLLMVGARGDDSNARTIEGDPLNTGALDAGAAHVLGRVGTTWSHRSYLKAFNADANDGYGHSVGISGTTLVVGAWAEDAVSTDPTNNALSASGAVYVMH